MYHGNWKFQAETSTDGWHARYVHKSALKTLERFGRRSRAIGWPGCTRGFEHGHGLLETERNDIPPEVDGEFTAHADLLAQHYGTAVAEQTYLWRLSPRVDVQAKALARLQAPGDRPENIQRRHRQR